jgi:hypothetical protein
MPTLPHDRGALLRARNSSLEAHQMARVGAAAAFPGSRATPPRNWLAEAVPSIVSRLARGGSEPLHVVHARGAGATAPWSGVLLPVEGEGVLLVRPIPSPTAGDLPVGAPTLLAPGGDGMPSPSGASPSYAAEAHGSSPRARRKQREGSGSTRATSYYGVVVQSQAAGACAGADGSAPQCSGDGQGAGCDGCYVLKLCSGGSAGAGSPGSTSYTLTRVCQGAALDVQLLEPWLQCANAQALSTPSTEHLTRAC